MFSGKGGNAENEVLSALSIFAETRCGINTSIQFYPGRASV